MGILNRVIGRPTWRTRSFSLAGRWLPAGAVLTGLALLGGAVPASAQTLTWSVVHSPNRRATSNILDAVSCASPSVCMATGHRLNMAGSLVTLAESWNGTRWSLVRSPNVGREGNQLVGVSCVSANACMAVGFTQGGPGGTLAESWNGSRWSVVHTPSPGNTGADLGGVSCVAADACTAVGAFSTNGNSLSTLVESWDGSRWSVVPSPSPGTVQTLLNGVSCASKTACSAAGYYNPRVGTRSLVESWDGSSWSVVPTPNPGVVDHILNGVSCPSPDMCMAAGFFFGQSKYRTMTLLGTATG